MLWLVTLSEAINPVPSNPCTDLPVASFTTKNGRNCSEGTLHKECAASRFCDKKIGKNLLEKEKVQAQSGDDQRTSCNYGNTPVKLSATKHRMAKKHSSCTVAWNASWNAYWLMLRLVARKKKGKTKRGWWKANFINPSLMVIEFLLNTVESLFWRGCCWGVEAAFLPPLWWLTSSHVYSDHAKQRRIAGFAKVHHLHNSLLRLFFTPSPHVSFCHTYSQIECRPHYETGFSVTGLFPSI